MEQKKILLNTKHT